MKGCTPGTRRDRRPDLWTHPPVEARPLRHRLSSSEAAPASPQELCNFGAWSWTAGVELGQACVSDSTSHNTSVSSRRESGEVKECAPREGGQIEARLRTERAGSEASVWGKETGSVWGGRAALRTGEKESFILTNRVQNTSYTFQRLQWSKSGTLVIIMQMKEGEHLTHFSEYVAVNVLHSGWRRMQEMCSFTRTCEAGLHVDLSVFEMLLLFLLQKSRRLNEIWPRCYSSGRVDNLNYCQKNKI